jgi:hypothetical protein
MATYKKKKKLTFKDMDGCFGGLEASLVVWVGALEENNRALQVFNISKFFFQIDIFYNFCSSVQVTFFGVQIRIKPESVSGRSAKVVF